MPDNSNIASFLPDIAEKFGQADAVSFRDASTTFSELEAYSSMLACEFRSSGLARGAKTLMMLRPGIEFIACVFGVFKAGAIPVFIDPGMGAGNLLNCISATRPEAMVGVAKAHWLRLLFRRGFASVRLKFSHDACCPPGVTHLPSFQEFKTRQERQGFKAEAMNPDETAAIVFTTGSTGPPKGVVYTHRIYCEQKRLISDFYGANDRERDMPAFPLFALFSSVMGMPSVIPDINPSLPAEADPGLIAKTIIDNNVSFSFASPALWRNLTSYCKENNLQIKTLKKALMAGAPVGPDLHRRMREIAPHCETMVPYGATEALPVANFAGSCLTDEIAEKVSSGTGYCLGTPLPGVKVHIITPVDGPIEKWDDSLLLPQGETGEIVVQGDVVTREYYNMPEMTRLAKIATADGKAMHRMGDMGFIDSQGLLWFKGRKSHRVLTRDGVMYPVCCEAVLKAHPKVFRAALVGVGMPGSQTPVAVIEPVPGVLPLDPERREKFIAQLKDVASKNTCTSSISNFLFMSPFPVDIRHNAKISREVLAQWAARRKICH